MKSWTFALLPFALASGFAGFAPAHSSVLPDLSVCESEAQSVNSSRSEQITPVDLYMRLVQVGLTDQSLSRADLEWTMAQSEPVLPFPDGRTLENFQLMKGFRRVMRVLQKADWPGVVNRLRAKLVAHSELEAKVAESRELTRPLLPWWKVQELPGSHFVASNGDAFFRTRTEHPGISDIHFLQKEVKFQTQFRHDVWPVKGESYFEAADGTVYHAGISPHTSLVVVNTRTGDLVEREFALNIHPDMKFSWSRAKEFSSFFSKVKFKPLLFEVEEGFLLWKKRKLKAALVPENTQEFHDASGTMPIITIDMETGKLYFQIIPAGAHEYRAMSDGNIYAFGLVRHPDQWTTALAFAHNISHNRTLLKSGLYNFSARQGDKIFNLYLDRSGKPQLLITGRKIFPEDKNAKTVRVKVLKDLNASYDQLPEFNSADNVLMFTAASGEPALAGVIKTSSRAELVVQLLESGTVRRVRILDANVDGHSLHVASTPKGPVLVLQSHDPASTEWNVRWSTVHFYDPATEVFSSQPFETSKLFPFFYLNTHRVLFTLKPTRSNVEFVPLIRPTP